MGASDGEVLAVWAPLHTVCTCTEVERNAELEGARANLIDLEICLHLSQL